MKIMKKMAAYILSLIMIVGMMPAITSDAADDSVSTWYTAYNAAKSDEQKFNGMRGYLATITSADEQYYIFSNLGGQLQAWIGGARTVKGSMQYDTKQITEGCLNP